MAFWQKRVEPAKAAWTASAVLASTLLLVWLARTATQRRRRHTEYTSREWDTVLSLVRRAADHIRLADHALDAHDAVVAHSEASMAIEDARTGRDMVKHAQDVHGVDFDDLIRVASKTQVRAAAQLRQTKTSAAAVVDPFVDMATQYPNVL